MILRSSSYDPIVPERIWNGFKAKEKRTYNGSRTKARRRHVNEKWKVKNMSLEKTFS